MNSQTEQQSLADQLIEEAATDYVGLWELLHGQTSWAENVRERHLRETLEVVRILLQRGLLAGDLAAGGKFVPWKDQSLPIVIDRIRIAWLQLDKLPTVGDICWFNRPLSDTR